MSAKVIDKREKKDQIIRAAVKSFAAKGFDKTTINDIAREAGIGKGTVYEYFQTKNEIIHYSFGFFIRAMELDLEGILVSKVSAEEKLKKTLHAFSKAIDAESEGLITMMFNFWGEAMRSQDAKNIIFSEMKKFYKSYRNLLADIIIEGMQDGSFKKNINPEGIAVIVIGMLDGVMVQWLLDKKLINYEETIHTLLTTILKGISSEK